MSSMESHSECGSAVTRALHGFAFAVAMLFAASAMAQSDPLPSWNEGPAKARVVAFVKAVNDSAGKDYVAPADRIAVFDNDGTLCVSDRHIGATT